MAKAAALGGGLVKKGSAVPAQVNPVTEPVAPLETKKVQKKVTKPRSRKPVVEDIKPTVALTVKLTEDEHTDFLMALLKSGKKKQQVVIRDLITGWTKRQ